jgi:hypothetical protein
MHDAPPPPLDRQGIGRLLAGAARWFSAPTSHSTTPFSAGYARRPGLFAAFATGSPGEPRDLRAEQNLSVFSATLNFADRKEDEILQAVAHFANGRCALLHTTHPRGRLHPAR